MKKSVLFLILACFTAIIVFAQDFTVFSVEGRVQKGTGYEKEEIVSGEILSGDTIVSISAGALLVINEGDRAFTIKPGFIGRIISFPPIARAIRRGLISEDDSLTDPDNETVRASDAAVGEEIIQEEPPKEVLYTRDHIEYEVVDEHGNVRFYIHEHDTKHE